VREFDFRPLRVSLAAVGEGPFKVTKWPVKDVKRIDAA